MPPCSATVQDPAARIPTRNSSRSLILLFCVLALSTLVITRGIRIGEFSYDVDEAQHAVTGLYVASLIHDHPLHPVQYTYDFYAQYPAVAIIHWPPLFYGVEGLFFLLLGPSVIAARLAILAFALLGLTAWFELVKELQDAWTAALSAAVLALLPAMLLFEKTVMLEIPCLSLCLAASCYWIKYLFHEKKSSLFWFAAFSSAALLTKQTAIYLPLFCLLSVIAVGKRRLLARLAVWWAVVAIALIIAPFYYLVYHTQFTTTVATLTDKRISSGAGWLYYFRFLPGQLGWIVLPLSLLGLGTSFLWDARRNTLLMVAWIVSCYLTFALIGVKEDRLSIYWLPPFVYFATGMLMRWFSRPLLKKVAKLAAIVLFVTSFAAGLSYRRPNVVGYSAAARAVTQIAPAGIILFDGDLPGNFIFFVRANDPHRHFLVLRKALYVTRINKYWGLQELVHGRDDIEDLLRKDGVRFVMVSDHMKSDLESERTLREMLQSTQFKLIGSFPIADTERPEGNNLRLYENELWAPPTGKFLTIRMLTLDHDLVVPLSQFDIVDDHENKQRDSAPKDEAPPR
jgi:hypothetical protein